MAASDDAGAVAALKELTARSKRDTLRGTAFLICHPALAAINRPDTADAALDAPAENLAASPSADHYTHEPRGSILLLVARNRIKRGESEAGRKRTAAYLETVDHACTRFGGH